MKAKKTTLLFLTLVASTTMTNNYFGYEDMVYKMKVGPRDTCLSSFNSNKGKFHILLSYRKRESMFKNLINSITLKSSPN